MHGLVASRKNGWPSVISVPLWSNYPRTGRRGRNLGTKYDLMTGLSIENFSIYGIIFQIVEKIAWSCWKEFWRSA
jgi:hypothetical protein